MMNKMKIYVNDTLDTPTHFNFDGDNDDIYLILGEKSKVWSYDEVQALQGDDNGEVGDV